MLTIQDVSQIGKSGISGAVIKMDSTPLLQYFLENRFFSRSFKSGLEDKLAPLGDNGLQRI